MFLFLSQPVLLSCPCWEMFLFLSPATSHYLCLTFVRCSDDHYRGGDSSRRGVTVISDLGVQYSHHQPAGHQLGLQQLPTFPAPQSHYMGQLAQPQTPAFSSQGHSGGYPGYTQPVAAVAPQQRYVPPRDERVDLNPGGRHKTDLKLGAGGVMGSMESLTSSQGSEISFGSTMSSNGKLPLILSAIKLSGIEEREL